MISCEQQKNKKCFINCARLLAGMLAVFLLQGCDTLKTPIEGNDVGALQKAFRASFNVDGRNSIASEPRTGQAIEIGYQGTTISNNQSLTVGQPPIYLSNKVFNSPNQLQNSFDFSYTDISWRWRHFEDRPIGTDILLGVGSSSINMAVTSPTQRASTNIHSNGLQGGLGLIFRATPRTSFHARASQFLSIEAGVKKITRREIFYTIAPHKNLSLNLGYADWRVSGLSNLSDSEFNMHFEGPAVLLNYSLNVGK